MTTEELSVLHFLWTGQIGGAERAVYQLAKEQFRQGTRVGVAFGQANGLYADQLQKLGCTVISLGASGGGDLRVLARAVKAIDGFDVHHFHGIAPLTFLASILSGSRVRVFTQRSGAIEATGRKRLRRFLARQALRHRFHAWCGNTLHAKETLSRSFDIPRDAIDVVHNGIDFQLLRSEKDRMEVRRSLGIGDDAFVVGTTAILKEWKRLHLLLEAGAMLDRNGLALLLVGDGPDKHRLESVARNLGIQDLVVFTGMRDQVVDLVRTMDAFVLPSGSDETFGNSVVEAMALGVPSAVFGDSPGLRGHIDPGKTGFVVNDVAELAVVLNRLRFDAALREAVGQAGANHVREAYGIERTAQGYAAAYLRGLTRWSARGPKAPAFSR